MFLPGPLGLILAVQFGGGSRDTEPDSFSFSDVTGAAPSTVTTSDPITIAGIDASAEISVSGGSYSINGGAFTSAAGTVVNGDQVRARGTSSASASTAVDVVVTIGGIPDTFRITTAAFNKADTTVVTADTTALTADVA